MKHLLADALHIFVIFMMVVFVVGGILAITGTFDHWAERYRLKRRRRRLLNSRKRNIIMGAGNNAPYNPSYPDKESIKYKGYA